MSDILMRTFTTPSIKPEQYMCTHTHGGGDGMNKLTIVSDRIEYADTRSLEICTDHTVYNTMKHKEIELK